MNRLKRLWFRMRGVDPDPVIVSFATGPAGLAREMIEEVRSLLPDYEHFTVEPMAGPTWRIWRDLRRRFRGRRIGMAPVLFGADGGHRPLRLAAFLLAPRKILAYNTSLERHHLRLSQPVASLLFWLGIPLDRIYLRPWWLWPLRRDRTTVPSWFRVVEGRPDSPARADVSVLTPFFPYPLAHGGAVRMFNLLREASVDYDITLFSFVENETAEDHAPLLEFCAKLVLAPKPRYREPRWSTLWPPEAGEYRSPVMRRLLAEHRKGPLQVEYTQLAPYLGDILVEHDITFDLYRQVHQQRRTLSSWWDLWRWRRFERAALRRAPAVVVMSEKDAVLAGRPDAAVIANGVDLGRFAPTPEGPGTNLLFIGSFRHFPNVSAFRFFLEDVWPGLAREFKDMTLTVVAGPDPLIHWPGRTLPTAERMELLEFVRDVRPLYERANIVLVPTIVSAGTNVKVLEALAMERAVVSTTSGVAGLGLEHGVNVWVADGAPAFREAVARLAADKELRRRIATAGRAHAERHFSWRKLGAAQRRLWSRFAPAPLSMRQATEADLDGISRIQAASREASQWSARDYLSHQVTVAELGDRMVAFAVVRATGSGEAELLNLATDPEFRRLGIARRLLDGIVQQVDGVIFLEVRESNLAARKLYEKMGFTIVSRRPAYYRDPVEAGIVMKLRT